MKPLKMKKPAHPGFMVKIDCLERCALTVTKGGKILHVSRSALSNLVNERADLSWEMAIRLAKEFEGTSEGWMRIPFQYDAAKVQERAKKIHLKPYAGDVVMA